MDLYSNSKPSLSVPPQSSTAATINGAAFDASNFKDVLGIVGAGAIAASTTVDAKFQDSDDGSTWADVSGQAITQLGATDDNKLGTKLRYRRTSGDAKKYVRLVIVIAGSGSALVCGIIVGGQPAQAPV